MKQGQATSSGPGNRKIEPKAHAVSEERVADIGAACAYTKTKLYKGRGYEAPKGGFETHKSGTQGKH